MKILPKTRTIREKNGKVKIVYDPTFSSFLEMERAEQTKRKHKKKRFQYF